MKRILTATILVVMGGAQSAHAQSLAGSDTLERVTQQLIAACPGAAGLTYAGGGTGAGEAAIVAGTQQIAPMSRAMTSCGGTNSAADGMLFGKDAIVVLTGSAQSQACGGGHAARTAGVAPTNPFADLAGTGTAWKNTLRTLYAGTDGSGSAAACGATDRRNLINSYASIFQGGCTTAPNCNFNRLGSPVTSGAIKHIFRRDDASGTTDTFKSLVGTITNFCNGPANAADQQDKDPVRRTCSDEESVCQADGTLGVLLPIRVPPIEGGATTINNDSMWYRTTAGNPNSVRGCQVGRFLRWPVSFKDPNCCFRGRAGDLSTTCLARPQFGLCFHPVSTDGRPCNNGLDTQCFDHNINAADAARGVADSRAYNLQVTNPSAPFDPASDQTGNEVLSAYYKLYWTRAGVNFNGTSSLCGTLDKSGLCQNTDSTQQIGCFASNVQCNVGFAGDEARRVAFGEPLALDTQDPIIGTNLNTSYPLGRDLFLATRIGLENTTGNQRALAQCFASNAPAAANNINGILLANGFFPAANPTGPAADPYCVDYCGAPDACAGNPAPFTNP
jgi:hypothetical protein